MQSDRWLAGSAPPARRLRSRPTPAQPEIIPSLAVFIHILTAAGTHDPPWREFVHFTALNDKLWEARLASKRPLQGPFRSGRRVPPIRAPAPHRTPRARHQRRARKYSQGLGADAASLMAARRGCQVAVNLSGRAESLRDA